ncbi:MAG: hypothetical protein GF408_05425 [Candidatus Omnitrophica bacterium]|nr:hypothetical protein [Candidatus Omnitrophota bacterium]
MKHKMLAILVVVALFNVTTHAEDVPSLKKSEEYHDIPVKVVKEVPLPKGWHEGLYFDGENMWVNNGEGINTWIVDVATGEVISEIEPVGTFSEGITPAGDGTYWVTDWETKKLYRVKITDGRMENLYDILLEPSRPTGVVWTGEHLYVITWTRGLGTRYHIMELTENERMVRKMRIRGIHEPSQMAWDGKHLWITSWYTKRVYRVDIENFRVLGSFRSPTSETTGIAWDGEYLWVTGTRSGLFQVEILED